MKFFKPIKCQIQLNYTQRFCPYLTGNTVCVHHKTTQITFLGKEWTFIAKIIENIQVLGKTMEFILQWMISIFTTIYESKTKIESNVL